MTERDTKRPRGVLTYAGICAAIFLAGALVGVGIADVRAIETAEVVQQQPATHPHMSSQRAAASEARATCVDALEAQAGPTEGDQPTPAPAVEIRACMLGFLAGMNEGER